MWRVQRSQLTSYLKKHSAILDHEIEKLGNFIFPTESQILNVWYMYLDLP